MSFSKFVAPTFLSAAPKTCSITNCTSTHSYSCPGCGAVHMLDCTCEQDDFLVHNKYVEPKISAADAIKFVSKTLFLDLATPTSEEIAKYDHILERFFSEWRERSDVPLEETAKFLFNDAVAVYYDCKQIPLDPGLEKAIKYYSQSPQQKRFEGKPRYFCDHPGSGLDTVNTLDSLIYEIVVFIQNNRDEFHI